MDRLLARLERRIGRYAIPNLILYVVGGMLIVWVMSFARPDVASRLDLDMFAVRRGQLWRLVTFLFVPPSPPTTRPVDMLLFAVTLYFTGWIGQSLEQHWGAFRFNAFYLVGTLGTIVAALIAGGASNTWLDVSLFLAFATVFPDVGILLFFVLPVRVKWLGWLAGAFLLYQLGVGSWPERAAIVAALSNYLLFFGEHWWGALKQRNVQVRQKARREQLRSSAPVFGQRVCAICGAREANGADIRVCSCGKCGGTARALCLEHARNH
jgi:hypothetical protein